MTRFHLRHLAMMCLVAVVAGSCWGGSSDAGDPSTLGPLIPRIEHAVTDGAASRFVPDPNVREIDGSFPPGDLTLTGCRWHGPGMFTYEMAFVPVDESLAFPQSFALWLDREMGLLTLREAGSFTVTIDAYLAAPDPLADRETWSVERDTLSTEVTSGCVISAYQGDTVFQDRLGPATVDLLLTGAGALAGSVEELALAVDLADPDDLLSPLPALLGKQGLPRFDRLYVAPGRRLDFISVSTHGSCMTITSVYDSTAPYDGIGVTQRLGCGAMHRSGDQRVIGISDDVWTVEVAGPFSAVDAFIDALELRFVAAVEPFERSCAQDDPDGSGESVPC